MKVNVDKVLERDAKLSELDSRAGKWKYVCFIHCSVIVLSKYLELVYKKTVTIFTLVRFSTTLDILMGLILALISSQQIAN